MLHFVSARLAFSYLLLCVLSCIGVLQIQAARQGLVGLCLPRGRGPQWWGYVVGSLLVIGSFAGFYALTPGLFVPGLAGSELAVLFGAGLILALGITLTSASLATRRARRRRARIDEAEEVVGPQLRGRLRIPRGSGPHPTLCLVPDMGSGPETLEVVSEALQAMGFMVLIIDWAMTDSRDHRTLYPDVLALIPAAISHLLQRPEVDERRIGVVGFGLGGDLALRAAGTDEQIAAVIAVEPAWASQPVEAGLDLLKHESLWQILRTCTRRKDRDAMAEKLDALTFLPQAASRPLLVLCASSEIRSSTVPVGTTTCPLPKSCEGLPWGHEVAHLIGRWCEENL